MTYLVDIVKMIIAFLTSIMLLALAVLIFMQENWIAAIIIFAVSVVYAVVALLNGRTVHLSEETVQMKYLCVQQYAFKWSEIKEVGVVGIRVLKSQKSKRVGAKYIYFSKEKMTDDERFHMCLTWAPKNVIYMRFSNKRVKKVMDFWKKDITMYNTADLKINN